MRTSDHEFFGIVRRDGAMIMFKALGVILDGKEVIVEPLPNFEIKDLDGDGCFSAAFEHEPPPC